MNSCYSSIFCNLVLTHRRTFWNEKYIVCVMKTGWHGMLVMKIIAVNGNSTLCQISEQKNRVVWKCVWMSSLDRDAYWYRFSTLTYWILVSFFISQKGCDFHFITWLKWVVLYCFWFEKWKLNHYNFDFLRKRRMVPTSADFTASAVNIDQERFGDQNWWSMVVPSSPQTPLRNWKR